MAILEEVVEQRMPTIMLAIIDKTSLSLHETLNILGKSSTKRLIQPCCYKEQYRVSLLSSAIRHFNTSVIRY